MEHKNLVATLYLKNGISVTGYNSSTPTKDDIHKLVKIYNDSGIDKILIFDLSDEDDEHEINIHTIKELCRMVEIPLCAGGNIKSLDDIKHLLYAGCKQIILNGMKQDTPQLAVEGAKRYGRDKITVSLMNVDILFKHNRVLQDHVERLFVLNEDIIDAVENVTEIPYTTVVRGCNLDKIVRILEKPSVLGIAGAFINDAQTDIMTLKTELANAGLPMNKFVPNMQWSDFKLNSDGMLPVIVQDYKTNEVLMMAYMNEEAYNNTIACGKMTYFSRSRQELWLKGATSGHYQYVKSLTADCDSDTLLAKVSQVGAACHTGAYSCFFKEVVKKEFIQKDAFKVFEHTYQIIADRKAHPKEGSYSNYLFSKGMDKMCKKLGEEATELIIAAKNMDNEQIKYEVADLLYHIMVLMVERGLSWEDITEEMSQR